MHTAVHAERVERNSPGQSPRGKATISQPPCPGGAAPRQGASASNLLAGHACVLFPLAEHPDK